jgi:hypothetical protein
LAALLILKTKGLESYGREKHWSYWTRRELNGVHVVLLMIVAWLLNSLSPTIATTIETTPSAAEVWKHYQNYTLERAKQGERHVMDYVPELQRLWTDLDHYNPIELAHAGCISTIKK